MRSRGGGRGHRGRECGDAAMVNGANPQTAGHDARGVGGGGSGHAPVGQERVLSTRTRRHSQEVQRSPKTTNAPKLQTSFHLTPLTYSLQLTSPMCLTLAPPCRELMASLLESTRKPTDWDTMYACPRDAARAAWQYEHIRYN